VPPQLAESGATPLWGHPQCALSAVHTPRVAQRRLRKGSPRTRRFPIEPGGADAPVLMASMPPATTPARAARCVRTYRSNTGDSQPTTGASHPTRWRRCLSRTDYFGALYNQTRALNNQTRALYYQTLALPNASQPKNGRFPTKHGRFPTEPGGADVFRTDYFRALYHQARTLSNASPSNTGASPSNQVALMSSAPTTSARPLVSPSRRSSTSRWPSPRTWSASSRLGGI
jgi:hypothetical protein